MSRRAFFERNLVEERKQHILMYKAKSSGQQDRAKRGNVAKENQKQRRDEEISKRRMPLSTIATTNGAQEKAKTKGVAAKKTDQRYEQLLKWREEKANRIEQQKKANNKERFAVRHVQHSGHPGSVLCGALLGNVGGCMSGTAKTTGKRVFDETKKEVVQSKRVTRSQARKQSEAKENPNKREGVVTRSRGLSETKHKPAAVSTRSAQQARVKKNVTKEKKDIPIVKKMNVEAHDVEVAAAKTEFGVASEPVAGRAPFASSSSFTFEPPKGVGSFQFLGKNFHFEPIFIPLSPRVSDSFLFGANAPDTLLPDTTVSALDQHTNSAGEARPQSTIGSGISSVSVIDEANMTPTSLPPDTMTALCDENTARQPFAEPSVSSMTVIDKTNVTPASLLSDSTLAAADKHTNSAVDGKLQPTTECSVANDVAVIREGEQQEAGEQNKGGAAAGFRGLVKVASDKLQALCNVWEKENSNDEVPEDVQGKIRTVIGQVQLLVTKKFVQFKQLIDLSEDPNAEHKTLESDLQGFWDMVYFQVEDIHKKFDELDKLKLRNWVEVKKPVKKRIKSSNTATRPTSTKPVTSSKHQSRTDFKKLRSQMKAKLREQQLQQNSAQDVPVTVFLSPLQKSRLDKRKTPAKSELVPGLGNVCTPDVLPNIAIVTRDPQTPLSPAFGSFQKTRSNEENKQPDDFAKKDLFLDFLYLQPSEAIATPPKPQDLNQDENVAAATDNSCHLMLFSP